MNIKRTMASFMTVIFMLSFIFSSVIAEESGVSGFVERLYTIALERNSDADGKAFWVDSLENHTLNGAQVAREFFFCQEFENMGLSEEEFILRLYKTFLNREPDQSGYDFWLDQMANGKGRNYVFNNFLNSPEWANICASYGIISGGNAVATEFVSDFVERIYTKALERPSDPDGRDFWVDGIIAGSTTGSQVAYGFFFGPEFKGFNLPNDEFINRLYRVFFNREADESGFNFWMETLQNGRSREYVFSRFTASPEWANICATYGIEQGTITVNENQGPANGLPGSDELNLPLVTPLDYTYEIYPIVANGNWLLYIKTENPDPYSFRLLDRDTIYADDARAVMPMHSGFLDVQYENRQTYRVYGGYICQNFYDNWEFFDVIDGTDGGDLELQYRERTSNKYTGVNYHNNYGKWISTNVIVHSEPLVDVVDYAIQSFTSPNNSFFENMNAIQSGVGSLSIYPRAVYNNTVNTGKYPAYAASPYPELSLNSHTELAYESMDEHLLLQWANPFDIDSAGFPSLMRSVAQRMNPDAVIEAGSSHPYIRVTYNGTTKSYGGAGAGGPGQLFLSDIQRTFTFRGGPNDFYTNNSLAAWREYYLGLCQNASDKLADVYDSLSFERFEGTSGTWLRVAYEGRSVGDYYYAYIYDAAFITRFSSISIADNSWVDGRYINRNNVYQDITFQESLQYNPSFLIPNMTFYYYDYYGNKKPYTYNIMFRYDSASGCWLGGSNNYEYHLEHYPELVYTREQVLALNLDYNHSTAPQSGYIYDGTAEPGTPFGN